MFRNNTLMENELLCPRQLSESEKIAENWDGKSRQRYYFSKEFTTPLDKNQNPIESMYRSRWAFIYRSYLISRFKMDLPTLQLSLKIWFNTSNLAFGVRSHNYMKRPIRDLNTNEASFGNTSLYSIRLQIVQRSTLLQNNNCRWLQRLSKWSEPCS